MYVQQQTVFLITNIERKKIPEDIDLHFLKFNLVNRRRLGDDC